MARRRLNELYAGQVWQSKTRKCGDDQRTNTLNEMWLS